ncbi:MAG: hypothetical protein D3910_05920 [Candidatus Electrothrix sp. ATG2]|nr:hypothetical protein [Candidatus Electrothrix sp. ATG2]
MRNIFCIKKLFSSKSKLPAFARNSADRVPNTGKSGGIHREHSLFINFTVLYKHAVNIYIIKRYWFVKTGEH